MHLYKFLFEIPSVQLLLVCNMHTTVWIETHILCLLKYSPFLYSDILKPVRCFDIQDFRQGDFISQINLKQNWLNYAF